MSVSDRAPALLLALTLALAATAAAQDGPETVPLWPAGAPGEPERADAARVEPHLIVHRAAGAAAAGPAVVICPGGGYRHLAMDHEGDQIARWLTSIGVTGVILRYRHRGDGYGHPTPLGDAQRALRVVRANAAAWRVDPARVGILGFSAGGHLASSAAVHHDGGDAGADDPVERAGCRPDFAVLCYPVIAFGEPFAHAGSQRNLLGAEPDAALVARMSSEKQVTATTPPTFLWHTTADKVVSVENSTAYYLALVKAGVPAELHVFEQGRHGIGLGGELPAARWPELCRRWLVARGVLE